MTGTAPQYAHWALAPQDMAVGIARKHAMARLGDWGFDGESEAAHVFQVLASELLTNAVRYRTGWLLYAVMRSHGGKVTFAVVDSNPDVPTMSAEPHEAVLLQRGEDGEFPVEELAEGQRGMFLVEQLADAHGCHPLEQGGKSVWFTLAIPALAQPVTGAVVESALTMRRRAWKNRIRAMRPRPPVHDAMAAAS